MSQTPNTLRRGGVFRPSEVARPRLARSPSWSTPGPARTSVRCVPQQPAAMCLQTSPRSRSGACTSFGVGTVGLLRPAPHCAVCSGFRPSRLRPPLRVGLVARTHPPVRACEFAVSGPMGRASHHGTCGAVASRLACCDPSRDDLHVRGTGAGSGCPRWDGVSSRHNLSHPVTSCPSRAPGHPHKVTFHTHPPRPHATTRNHRETTSHTRPPRENPKGSEHATRSVASRTTTTRHNHQPAPTPGNATTGCEQPQAASTHRHTTTRPDPARHTDTSRPSTQQNGTRAQRGANDRPTTNRPTEGRQP